MAVDKEEALPTSTMGAVQRSRPAESIEVTFKSLIMIINQYFRQCFRGMYVRGCTVVANVVGLRDAF